MAEYRLDLKQANLHEAGMKEARKRVSRVVRRTYNRSAVLCPVDTGYLRASGRMMPATIKGSEIIGGVVYGAHYAATIHEGRRELVIRAKRKKALRFKISKSGVGTRRKRSRVIVVKSVRQPARAGRPFLATALREVAAGQGFTVVSIG